MICYGVLPFGWAGSPGHFTTFAMAAEAATQGFAPTDPRTEGGECFWVKTHVNDAGGMEPDVGERVHQGPVAYGENTRELFGRDAIHRSKGRQEGAPTPLAPLQAHTVP